MAFCKHRVMDKCKKDGRPCIFSNDCFEPEEPKAMTNGDRIRAMSDKALAEFLDDCNSRGCVCGARDCRTTCQKCIEDWLKEPVKEENL